MVSHIAVQTDRELTAILLTQPIEYWEYRHVSPQQYDLKYVNYICLASKANAKSRYIY